MSLSTLVELQIIPLIGQGYAPRNLCNKKAGVVFQTPALPSQLTIACLKL